MLSTIAINICSERWLRRLAIWLRSLAKFTMSPTVSIEKIYKIILRVGDVFSLLSDWLNLDTRVFIQSHPLPLIIEHKHPFGLKNPKFQCFFNSVLQLIFSIFRNNSYTSPFNSSTEGTLLKCLLQTAHNACNSKDVDALKFQLVRRDIFYNGQNQQDSTECLLMSINIIDKGSMPDSSSTTSPMGVFFIWPLVFICFGKIYCLRSMWTEVPLIWI